MYQDIVDKMALDAGIYFDWVKMSKSMVNGPQGWNRNLDEEVDAKWWKEYLNQKGKSPFGSEFYPSSLSFEGGMAFFFFSFSA